MTKYIPVEKEFHQTGPHMKIPLFVELLQKTDLCLNYFALNYFTDAFVFRLLTRPGRREELRPGQ
jgi:hypothetical protein